MKDFSPTGDNHDQTIESLRFVAALAEDSIPATIEYIDGVQFLVKGTTVVDLTKLTELYQSGPRRIKASQEFIDVRSFATYLARFGMSAIGKDLEVTPLSSMGILKASIKNAQVVAAIDYHTAADPAWCEHLACLVSKRTPEWESLKNASGKYVSQSEFALYLDRYASWVVQPDAASLAESVMQLEGTNNSAWSSKVNRSTGAYKFSVQEEVLTNVEIPQKMILDMAPFYHSPAVAVTAKIRFKIGKDGTPTFALEVDNLEKIEYDALIATFTDVQNQTGLTVLVGP